MSGYRITDLDRDDSRDPRFDPMEIAGAVIAVLVGVAVVAGGASNVLFRPQEVAVTATTPPAVSPPSAAVPLRIVSGTVLTSSRGDVRVVPLECPRDFFILGPAGYASPQPDWRVAACYQASPQP